MSEQPAPKSDSVFSMPTNAQEYSALGLAVLAVLLLVQFGAPLVRELAFLDQKIREYFIGGAFAAFPLIHRGAKQAVAGFKPLPPVRPELSPWFVSGAFAAAAVYAWNVFVTMVAGIALSGFAAATGAGAQMAPDAISNAVTFSITAFSLPLIAAASIYAGILLARNTRSHVVLALAFAGLLFILFNLVSTWALNPQFLSQQWDAAIAENGAMGAVLLAVGMGFVAAIVFVFGGVGVLISQIMSERSLGKVMVAARRLSPADREVLAADITKRVEEALRAKASGGVPPAQP